MHNHTPAGLRGKPKILGVKPAVNLQGQQKKSLQRRQIFIDNFLNAEYTKERGHLRKFSEKFNIFPNIPC
ncbi:MAG: hypothetical protein LBU34_15540 [Planctomycetaceae bacterium]|nr:hypothetical protein [Planctomycetaceae bacterium]